MIIGKTRTNQPVEGDAPAMAKALDGQDVNLGDVTGDSIIENMSGYSYTKENQPEIELDYVGVVKTGNKITFVQAGRIIVGESGISAGTRLYTGTFIIPENVGIKIVVIRDGTNIVDSRNLLLTYSSTDYKNSYCFTAKATNASFYSAITPLENLIANQEYAFRYEITFLLGDNLIPQE